VRRIAGMAKNRKKIEVKEWVDATWYVRDATSCYGTTADGGADFLDGEDQALKGENSLKNWREAAK
jgi:hypothetical protein